MLPLPCPGPEKPGCAVLLLISLSMVLIAVLQLRSCVYLFKLLARCIQMKPLIDESHAPFMAAFT